MLVLKDRLLSADGSSVIDLAAAASFISREGKLPEGYFVENTEDTRRYEMVYGEDVVFNEVCDAFDPPNTIHNDSQLETVLNLIENSPRYKPEFVDRVADELIYFEKTNNIKFLIALHELISRFEEDGVVWGVGRGSSVASLVLYCLFVHDINPLMFDIPFHELSKET